MRLPSTNRLNNSRRSTAALTLAEADQLTVHVIGIRVKGYTWMGEQSLLDTECLAEQNGGLYIGVESEDNLAKALERIDKLPQAITRRTGCRDLVIEAS
jgi:hypothetical protein